MEHYNNRTLEDIVEEYEGVIYKEQWRKINSYKNDYYISSFGRIKSAPNAKNGNRWIVLKQSLDRKGYCKITLRLITSKPKTYLVHQLVSIHFIANPLKKKEVNHKKGIKTDNRFHQIEWCSSKENKQHGILHNLINGKGSRNVSSILKEWQVLEIISSTLSPIELSVKYNVGESCIRSILNGSSWSHLTGIVHNKKYKLLRLTDDEVRYIRRSPLFGSELAKIYNVTPEAIYAIRGRKSYPKVD